MSEEAVKVEAPVEVEAPLPPLPQFGAILGSAGTGKTTLIKKYLSHRRDVVVSATTGVAALNTGGTTIHSRLGYYDLFSLQIAERTGRLVKSFVSYYFQGVKVWIVDEVSMMGGDQLTILAKAIEEANQVIAGRAAYRDTISGELSSDYRYISMVLVGDFAQLPPVKAPWAFESPAWNDKFATGVSRLTTNYRQSNPEFIAALRAAREGHGPGALSYFRDRIFPTRDESFGGLTIMATNAEVDLENARKLAICTGELITFQNKKEGQPHRLKDWKAIPETLELKVGAKVMILSNYRTHQEGLVYVNGDMGILVGLDDKPGTQAPYRDELDGNPSVGTLPVVRLERNGAEVTVERAERDIKVPWDRATEQEKTDYLNHLAERKAMTRAAIEKNVQRLDLAVDDYDRDTLERTIALDEKILADMEDGKEPDFLVVAWMKYTPLRLAYASTVHKCQGLTLDKIQIDLAHPFWGMCPGSLYVALSRARTPEGIRIVGTNERFLARCRSEWKVRSFV